MSLDYERAKFTELTGADGTDVSIGVLISYLDGYKKGRADAIDDVKQFLYQNTKASYTELIAFLDRLDDTSIYQKFYDEARGID